MSESSGPDIEKQFGPQDQGLKESRSFNDRLKSGQMMDDISEKLNSKTDRRSFIVRTGTMLGLAAAAAGLKQRQGSSELTPPPPQSRPQQETGELPPQLANDIQYLIRNEEGKLEYSNVAQYYDADFVQLNDGQGKPILVRNEHKQNSDKTQELTAEDMNDHQIGVIRVAGVNQDNARPEDSFIDDNKNFVYEWLALVRLTDDPEHPYVYVDGTGNVSDEPWFVSPNFATLKPESQQVFNPPKPEALQ